VTDIRDRGHRLRFGIVTPPMWRSWDELVDLWTRAERCGFDLAFNTDHFQSDWDGDTGPTLEAWTMLAALAVHVPRMQIGTYVTGITHRPVAVLAKQAVTVDHVSGGRLILGLGAAWNEPEHAAYGLQFPPIGDRVGLVEEALDAFRRLETEARVDFDGRYLTLRSAPFEPKPVGGRIPVLIGSRRPRMLRAAARSADFVDFSDAGAAEVVGIGEQLAANCAAIGRDPNEIAWMNELHPRSDPAAELTDAVEALAPLGVSVFLVNIWPRRDPSDVDRAAAALDGLRRRWA
jgi:alkanesulfonate monooxygenase SsuD/methylene tetrahydromethanopterin reductase-like flavin-dependent oxidoreductase (luciferase family)